MTDATVAGDRHVSNVALRLTLDVVGREAGGEAVDRVVAMAGDPRPLEELRDDAGWSSYRQFRALLEASVEILGSDAPIRNVAATTDLSGGSTPSVAEMLQSLGSPGVLLAELGKGHTSMVNFLDVTTQEVGPTEWLIEFRNRPGFPPYPAFCAFSAGIYPMTPRLFGYEQVEAVEEECQNRGDDRCRFRLRWEEVEEQTRVRNTLEQRITLLERRLETFQSTVANLVLVDDLDTALQRVVQAASRAVRAPGFVIVVEPLEGMPARVYSDGMTPQETDRVAELLMAGEELPGGSSVVEIASSRRHYGRLATYDPTGMVLGEASMLAAYARLAATALDSASALEETRREAERARALLRLSAALAEVVTIDEMAVSLVRAVPTVVDADRAVMALIDHADEVVRIVACHGFPTAEEARLLTQVMPVSESMPETIRYLGPHNISEHAGHLMTSDARVVVPVVVDGRPEGWLAASVVDRPERLAPGAELEARLLGLAAQASTALANARLIEQIRYQALHDVLTGLPNRALILDRAEKLIARSRRDRTPFAALFLDLDGFKEINDTLGHAAGDQLLLAVANRLSATVRESDTLARLGGDEFVVLVEGAPTEDGPELVAQRLLDVLQEPFVLEGHEGTPLSVTMSIGIAQSSPSATHEGGAGALLRDADVALYQAKAAGKNRYVTFTRANGV